VESKYAETFPGTGCRMDLVNEAVVQQVVVGKLGCDFGENLQRKVRNHGHGGSRRAGGSSRETGPRLISDAIFSCTSDPGEM
jgi:hypothetical protein